MPETELDGMKVEYDVRHSEDAKRPRIDSKLGNIRVVVPEKDKDDLDAEDLLEEKKNWVLNRQQEYFSFKRKVPERNFEEGESFPYLSDEKIIKIGKGKSEVREESIILSRTKVENKGIKDTIEDLYRDEVRKLISRKIDSYIEEINGEFNQIYVRDQRTRWGSCSSKQNLNFNWRLLLAPEHVLEYVIVHELVHLEVKDHNDEFWSKVRSLYPDYLESNRWLEENSPKLVLDEDL